MQVRTLTTSNIFINPAPTTVNLITDTWTRVAASMSYSMMTNSVNNAYYMGLTPYNYSSGNIGFLNRVTSPSLLADSVTNLFSGPLNAGYTK